MSRYAVKGIYKYNDLMILIKKFIKIFISKIKHTKQKVLSKKHLNIAII